ncbi:MAG: viperin family antiviral radical SAM protein [Polyangiaceae bacterium]
MNEPRPAGAPGPLPPSVNYHLWQPCNMRCGYCFAVFADVKSTVLPKGHLPKPEALAVAEALARRFEKVTFVGGEPTLCPWLFELVRCTKEAGAVTMIVTNGSVVDDAWFDRFAGWLDWFTLSIDSASSAHNIEVGRVLRGHPLLPEHHIGLAHAARARGMRLKVNTVVTRGNAGEDMRELLEELAPERWKIFQALPVEGQNDARFGELSCTEDAFRQFIERHAPLRERGIAVVPEDNHLMRGSYAMVDPAGRFYDNVDGPHRYSRPILRVGVEAAWGDVAFSMERFDERGGRYEIGSAGGRQLPVIGG